MNMILKILAAVALVAIIIATGVFTIKTLTTDSTRNVSSSIVKGEKNDIEEIPTKPDKRSKPIFQDEIVVRRDDPIQPRYKPVNQPTYLQNIREEGKTYHSRVMGKVDGQASKKDWGVRGSAYFTYVYGLESIGKIIKNDGLTIIEERTFGKVTEDVIVSKYDIGFELPSELSVGLSAIEILFFDGNGSIAPAVINTLNQIKIPFTDSMFNALRDNDMLPKTLDPQRVKNEMMMFAKLKDGRILEGKKVRIVFKDGQGITSITPINCKLSQQEVDVIKRTNYVMDHYLFPDQQVQPGSTWTVNGDVFAAFLDPRLHGRVGGEVTVSRVADFTDAKGEIAKRLRLVGGHISFTDNSSRGSAVTGQLSGLKGLCSIPDKYGVITSATMRGNMVYRNVSTDHLLFEAEMRVTPRFEISYECAVE